MSNFILGSVEITNEAIITHRDSYLLQNLTVVSVRRPFLAPALLVGVAFTVFCLGFMDLLYAHEIIVAISLASASIIAGMRLGRLQLLSRDLKNTELSGAIWGDQNALQKIRIQIVEAMKNHEGSQ